MLNNRFCAPVLRCTVLLLDRAGETEAGVVSCIVYYYVESVVVGRFEGRGVVEDKGGVAVFLIALDSKSIHAGVLVLVVASLIWIHPTLIKGGWGVESGWNGGIEVIGIWQG